MESVADIQRGDLVLARAAAGREDGMVLEAVAVLAGDLEQACLLAVGERAGRPWDRGGVRAHRRRVTLAVRDDATAQVGHARSRSGSMSSS